MEYLNPYLIKYVYQGNEDEIAANWYNNFFKIKHNPQGRINLKSQGGGGPRLARVSAQKNFVAATGHRAMWDVIAAALVYLWTNPYTRGLHGNVRNVSGSGLPDSSFRTQIFLI